MISLKVLAQSIRSHNTMPVLVCWGFLRSRLPLIQTCVSGECAFRLWILSVKVVRQFSSLSALTAIKVGQSWCPLIKQTAAAASAPSARRSAFHSSWSRCSPCRKDWSWSSRFSSKNCHAESHFRWLTYTPSLFAIADKRQDRYARLSACWEDRFSVCQRPYLFPPLFYQGST